MDTASNAGPRFAFEGFTGSFPHVVPAVPAPKSATPVDEVEAEEGDAEVGEEDAEVEETTASRRVDVVLEYLKLVVDAEVVGVDDGAEEVEEAEASDAEEMMLGQKVLLHVCIFSRSLKEHVDFAKHGVTEDLMVAAFAVVHWQR